MDKKFLTFSETAELLRISKPTVERLVAEKIIPSYKIGKRRLFDPEELIEWVKSHRDDKPKMKKGKKK
jgi:excisionase family DNA binding protein